MKNSGRYVNLHDQLIKDCLKGNRRSQFELYKLYYKAMFNTAYRMINNYSEAEDIMQEAFLKAFQNLESYKAEVSFGAWLKRIVVNHCLDNLRKRKIEFTSIEDNPEPVPQEEIDSSWEIEDNLLFNQVINEINKLPVGYKMVISLYLIEGYDHDEIADILKISPSTSRSQFLRAKKKLVENLNAIHIKT